MSGYGHDRCEVIKAILFGIVISLAHSLAIANHAAAATFSLVPIWSEVFIEFVVVIWSDDETDIEIEVSLYENKEPLEFIKPLLIFLGRIDVAVIEEDRHIEVRAKEKERPARARAAAAMKKKPWFFVAMEVFDLLKADVVIVRLLDVHP